jgi:endogenous inhibitor of DNA gyrase (YacG/DUF329 family)
MQCPLCKKEARYEGNPDRPFCSERCKLIDLDNWLSERYRISIPVEDDTLADILQTDIAEEEESKGERD